MVSALVKIWIFPIKIASHSERLSKYVPKEAHFRERNGISVSAMFSFSGKEEGL